MLLRRRWVVIKTLGFSLGFVSYAAGAFCLVVDNLLWLISQGLRKASDRFILDGDLLTGTNVGTNDVV